MGVPRAVKRRRGWFQAKDPNDAKRTVMASPNMGHFRGTPVYLFVEDKTLHARVVDADLHDDLAKGAQDAKLFELEICCPRCSAWNRIPGNKKDIEVRYFDKPKPFQHPHDGEIVYQSAVVTVEQALTCSEPVGKTICGYTFVIRENRIIRA